MHPEAVQTRLGLACLAHQPRDLICLHLSFSFSVATCDSHEARALQRLQIVGLYAWDGCHPQLPQAPCSKNRHQGARGLPASIGTFCPSSVFRRPNSDSPRRGCGRCHIAGDHSGHYPHSDLMSEGYMDASLHRPDNLQKQIIMPVTL